jgi:hypothetical protein
MRTSDKARGMTPREWRFWILLTASSALLLLALATANVVTAWAGGSGWSIFMFVAAACGAFGLIWLLRVRQMLTTEDR